MSIQQGKGNEAMTIFARIFDQETPPDSLTAKIYYKIGAGPWAGDVTGSHITNGFFRFIIPSSDMVAVNNPIYYYFKATDGDGEVVPVLQFQLVGR